MPARLMTFPSRPSRVHDRWIDACVAWWWLAFWPTPISWFAFTAALDALEAERLRTLIQLRQPTRRAA